MRIHIRREVSRPRCKDGDQKMIGGVLHERITRRVCISTFEGPRLAYDKTGGKQRHEWVPVDQLVGESPYKRRRFEEIDE